MLSQFYGLSFCIESGGKGGIVRKFFLESTKSPGLMFEIVKLDRSTMRAQLLGGTGVTFERCITKESLDRFGYKVVVKEEE